MLQLKHTLPKSVVKDFLQNIMFALYSIFVFVYVILLHFDGVLIGFIIIPSWINDRNLELQIRYHCRFILQKVIKWCNISIFFCIRNTKCLYYNNQFGEKILCFIMCSSILLCPKITINKIECCNIFVITCLKIISTFFYLWHTSQPHMFIWVKIA